MPRSDWDVRVTGFKARSLERIGDAFDRKSTESLREVAREVRKDAQSFAPVRSGALKSSLRYQASQHGASVLSSLVYAGVVEYGGTIAPRGAPITIKGAEMIRKAVRKNADDIEDELARKFDDIARRHGFY